MPQTRLPAPAASSPHSRRTTPTLSTWIVGAVTLVVLLVLAMTSGVPGVLAWVGGVGTATALYVVVSGRRSWALLPGRKMATVAFAASVTLLVSGVSLSDQKTFLSDLAGTGSHAASAIQPTTRPIEPQPTLTPSLTHGDAAAADSALVEDTLDTGDGTQDADESATSPAGASALQVLASLPIKGRAPKTGYDRTGMFGEAWIDVDSNGCDTRNDILARDLTQIVTSGTCRVLSGTLTSPYTSELVDFVRGNDTSALVQIDHVVALSNAWQTGAQQLSPEERKFLANDPLNLLAVDGRSNSQKGDGDAATWLPSSKGIRCSYIARQISVKATYGLWVTQSEHDSMATILSECADEPSLTSALATAPVLDGLVERSTPPADIAPSVPVSTPVAPEPSAPATEPVPDAFFKNCDAVRAAGAAPLTSEQPGYSFALDRDRDGIACET